VARITTIVKEAQQNDVRGVRQQLWVHEGDEELQQYLRAICLLVAPEELPLVLHGLRLGLLLCREAGHHVLDVGHLRSR
jgi:hypothetical protein